MREKHVAAEEFTERMRERMPAHRTWHPTVAAPAVSRTANDALWDDMRTRLRAYETDRRAIMNQGSIRGALEMVRRSAAAGSLVAVFIAAGLLLIALLSLGK